MELGKTVVLLNLEHLYESLYDALNQFYYKFGDNEKFVDLGLGTQRIKCLVHDEFRLIVIADKNIVYDTKRFPIPLVNRLEKHCLSVDSILNDSLNMLVLQIKNWWEAIAQMTSNLRRGSRNTCLKVPDVLIGFTDDTVASLVLKFSKILDSVDDEYEWHDESREISDK